MTVSVFHDVSLVYWKLPSYEEKSTIHVLVLNRVLMLGSQAQTVIGKPILPDAAVHAVLETKLLNYFSVSCIYFSNSVGMHAHLITESKRPRSAVSPCICFLFEQNIIVRKNGIQNKINNSIIFEQINILLIETVSIIYQASGFSSTFFTRLMHGLFPGILQIKQTIVIQVTKLQRSSEIGGKSNFLLHFSFAAKRINTQIYVFHWELDLVDVDLHMTTATICE
ncbi:hypothetical protein ACJX0J_021916 [Zea mays]